MLETGTEGREGFILEIMRDTRRNGRVVLLRVTILETGTSFDKGENAGDRQRRESKFYKGNEFRDKLRGVSKIYKEVMLVTGTDRRVVYKREIC